jgi:hypothetical protein
VAGIEFLKLAVSKTQGSEGDEDVAAPFEEGAS